MDFRKLPRRYGALVTPFFLSLLMTCVVSAISVLKTQGFGPAAFGSWPTAWLVSWPAAFPVLLLALPVVRRLTGLVVEG